MLRGADQVKQVKKVQRCSDSEMAEAAGASVWEAPWSVGLLRPPRLKLRLPRIHLPGNLLRCRGAPHYSHSGGRTNDVFRHVVRLVLHRDLRFSA